VCLDLCVPDALGLAFALGAILLDRRGRPLLAIAAGVAAVLAKEPTFLVLAGYALWRGGRHGARFAGVPAAAGAAWWVWLAVSLPQKRLLLHEFDPGRGLVRSINYWVTRGHVTTTIGFVACIALAALALRRGGLRQPFGWAIAIQLAFIAMMSRAPLVEDHDATRTLLPLLVLGVLAWCSTEVRHPVRPPRAAPASAR
jgi:hypothetical protein